MSKFIKLPLTSTKRDTQIGNLAGWMLNRDTIMMFWVEIIRDVKTLRILSDYGAIDIPERYGPLTSDIEATIKEITTP